MKKQGILMWVLAFCLPTATLAQSNGTRDSAVIRLIAKAYGDSIVLRWAPADAMTWKLLNSAGYHLLRMEKNSNGQWKQLNAQPIMPQSLEVMKRTLDRNNKYAAIAAQALYGKDVQTSRKGLAPVVSQEADELNNRFALAIQSADYSAAVAQSIGLRWTDRQVNRGEAYLYKLVPAKTVPQLVVSGTSLLVVNDPQPLLQPEGLVAFGGDHKAELQWPRQQPENYSGYQVEVSTDGKSFRTLHESPYYSSLPDTASLPDDSLVQQLTDLLQQQHLFIDSLKNNYSTYYYRIRGINAFGEWSAYSAAVTVSGRDLTPPGSLILGTPEATGKRSIRLQWNKLQKEPDLKGYFVYRARQVDGQYALLHTQPLSLNTSSFTDTEAFEHGPNFYIVAAVDTAGNQNPSIPVMGLLPDTTAPLMPAGLQGHIDSSGLVHLSWKENQEEDIKGYKVYFAHEPSQPFTQITLYPSEAAAFTDSITLHTLTSKIYYRVVAVDQHNNHSDYSAVLELKKPDLVAPVPPVILDASISAQRAVLELAPSASTDVKRYEIMRKEGAKEWMALASLPAVSVASGFQYHDTTAKHGIVYEYAARAIDESGLESALCTPVRLQLRGTALLPAIAFTTARYDAQQGAVVLEWKYASAEPHYLVLYRSVAGAPLERYRTLEKGQSSWKDLQVPEMEKGYQYAIQAVFGNHARMTRLPDAVVVRQ